MSWIKYSNIQALFHPGSYADVKKWLKNEKASLSDKKMDEFALQAILSSESKEHKPDYEKALQLLNIKLKQHIKESKE